MGRRFRLLWGVLVCCLIVSGCHATEKDLQTPDPASFAAIVAAAMSDGNQDILAAFEGNTCQVNGPVTLSQKSVFLRCGSQAVIQASISQEDLDRLEPHQVVALTGTVKQVEISSSGSGSLLLEPAQVTDTQFTITGTVEKIYHDWERDGQDYAAVRDSSVLAGSQVNIYLPVGHTFQEGDTLTAQGVLLAPSNLGERGVALLPGQDTDKVLLMENPSLVEKEESP